jgi:dipeptide/tripeptide permease
VGLVYLLPIFGGLIADRWLGRTRTVVIGALLMATGHFLMAVEAALLPALGCLLLGVGCFKGNIAAQVGDLYAPGDKRRAHRLRHAGREGGLALGPRLGRCGHGHRPVRLSGRAALAAG